MSLRCYGRQNPATEPFFSDEGAEPFFVKNLENVQEDERGKASYSMSATVRMKPGRWPCGSGP